MDLYKAAATVLEKFENKRGSVKGLVFASEFKNVRQLYALVCESLKYQHVLTDIFHSSTALQAEKGLQGQGHLATVLLYEHLVGKGLGRAGAIRNCIMKHKSGIQKKCGELMKERGVTSLGDLLSPQCQAVNKSLIPRYARVNLLKTTVQEAVAMFTEEGWQWRGGLNLKTFPEDLEALGQEGFGSDPLIPDLLIFPPGTELHNHPWVKGGCLLLQDRASCFPAHVLNPAPGSTVLDCCAAPGNKTSHAASLMNNTGKIWAFERDVRRMSLLQQQLRKNGVSVATAIHQDFLSVNPRDERFAGVQYVLVDPSCSGSGIIDRMDFAFSPTNNNPDSKNTARLHSLQRFQISILKHALRFPNARRVVYSTCSVYEEENEKVVSEVAQQVGDRFRVEKVFPQFPHRGIGDEDIAEKCLRTSPEKDRTNGFFVACFERISGDDDDDDDVSTGNSENVCEEEREGNAGGGKDDSVAPSRKRNKKRKRERDSKAADNAPDVERGGFCAGENPNGEPDLEFGETPKKKKKKNKSKKKKGENASGDLKTQQKDPNGEPELDVGETPKKKKKKCKSKKKVAENVSEGLKTGQNNQGQNNQNGDPAPDFDETPKKKKRKSKKRRMENRVSEDLKTEQNGCQVTWSNTAEDSSLGDDLASEKPRTLGKRNEKVKVCPDSRQAADVRIISHADTSDSKGAGKKKAKKKRKRSTELETSSTLPDLDRTDTCVPMATAGKKKLKKKRKRSIQ